MHVLHAIGLPCTALATLATVPQTEDVSKGPVIVYTN